MFRTRRRPASRSIRLSFIPLEDRTVPAVFTVSNVNNAGPGSLRQAITNANAQPGLDTINFDPGVFNTARTIALFSTLPGITGPTIISGPGSNLLTVTGGPTTGPAFNLFNDTLGSPARVTGMTLLGASGLGGNFRAGTDVALSPGATLPGNAAIDGATLGNTENLGDANQSLAGPGGNSDTLAAFLMANRFRPGVTFDFSGLGGGLSPTNDLGGLGQFQSRFGTGVF